MPDESPPVPHYLRRCDRCRRTGLPMIFSADRKSWLAKCECGKEHAWRLVRSDGQTFDDARATITTTVDGNVDCTGLPDPVVISHHL